MRQTYLTSDNPTVVTDCARTAANTRVNANWRNGSKTSTMSVWRGRRTRMAREPSKELKPSCPRRP